MKMKRGLSARNSQRRSRKKLVYIKSSAKIPDFRSDDEIAEWYQRHSTVLIQDQLETLPASVGGKLRSRLIAQGSKENRLPKGHHRTRSSPPR
jgi:hypothetical protein